MSKKTVNVVNTNKGHVTAHAEDGSSVIIPHGGKVHTVHEKFLWNLPPGVKLEGGRPMVSSATPPSNPTPSSSAAPTSAAATTSTSTPAPSA